MTAAELLSMSAFLEGKYAQAFPSFGSERTGAPVIAFCRINDTPIRNREPVNAPNVLLLQDSTLLHQMDIFGGLSPQGQVLINSSRTLDELHLDDIMAKLPAIRIYTLPASEMATRHLGRPIVNAALVAGFAAITGVVGEPVVEQAIKQRFPGRLGDDNVAVAREAHAYMTSLLTPA